MLKKRKILVKAVAFLMVYATILPLNGASIFFIGEPQLPKRMLKDNIN